MKTTIALAVAVFAGIAGAQEKSIRIEEQIAGFQKERTNGIVFIAVNIEGAVLLEDGKLLSNRIGPCIVISRDDLSRMEFPMKASRFGDPIKEVLRRGGSGGWVIDSPGGNGWARTSLTDNEAKVLQDAVLEARKKTEALSKAWSQFAAAWIDATAPKPPNKTE